ncbi:hypothetical protein ZWY2020_002980 [Hordeum vulgare]|nr:hypothetical protein ZWY2020_002980 [Hordeum vulgare]
MCSEPTTLADLMAKEDKYSTSDSMMRIKDGAYGVFTSEGGDKQNQCQCRHEVNATMSLVPQYMHSSKKPVTWSRIDHPDVMPNPDNYALVLDPTITSKSLTCRFSRVLFDGGSSINILYLDTLLMLGLKEKDL